MKIERETSLTFPHKTSARSLRRFLETVPDDAVVGVRADRGDGPLDRGSSSITATWTAEIDLEEGQ